METVRTHNFTIVRAKLSEQIADRLEDVILNEELEDQAKLPSEQVLADNFNVSKNVVRESLNILKERGLVESRNGTGNFVTRPKADNLSDVMSRMIVLDNIDYKQIYDTRMVLETSACKRAADQISEKELEELEQLQKKLMDKTLSVQERRETDLDFHIMIARASGNHLLAMLIQAMRNIIQDAMFLEKNLENWSSVDEAMEYHSKILNALSEHDASTAEEEMHEHLKKALQNVEKIV